MKRWLVFLTITPLLALAISRDQKAPDAIKSANDFIASLDKDLHKTAVMQFDSDYRTHWRYTPASREGVNWSDLNPEQTAKAITLLKTTLSELGFARTKDIRTLEGVLEQMESNPGRDKDSYYFTFFGVPGKSSRWGWRYEGHHISLNFTYDGGKLIASTPQFFGANPAEVQDGKHKGMRVLAQEEDLAIALINSLTTKEKKIAIISQGVPPDIFSGEKPIATNLNGSGIRADELSLTSQKLLLKLITANAISQNSEEAQRKLAKLTNNNLVFAWMGATDRSGPHYYRIQSPAFLIEFDNTQNGSNHIHLVWREFEGDFGRDVLKDHYASHSNDPGHGHDE